MSKLSRPAVAIVCAAFFLSGCQTMPQLPYASGPAPAPAAPLTGPGGCKYLPGDEPVTQGQASVTGAAIGTLVGGIAGSALAKNKAVGARNGALLGAFMGAIGGSAYANSVAVTQNPNGDVKINMPGNVVFPINSYALNAGVQSTLTAVAGSIKEYCGISARVIGHTDSTGRRETNQMLSENRARSVVDYLISQGVSPSLLTAEGMADTNPIAPNNTEDGRQQNRRVEILIQQPMLAAR